MDGSDGDQAISLSDGTVYNPAESPAEAGPIPLGSARHPVLLVAALATCVGVAGWWLGRAERPTAPSISPHALLSIETLTGNAAQPPSHAAVPRLSGYLVVEGLGADQTVVGITWGGTRNIVIDASSPIEVTLTTTIDCRDVEGNPATFPSVVADVRASDGTTSTLPVTPLNIARWGNVAASCADPTHPAATNSL